MRITKVMFLVLFSVIQLNVSAQTKKVADVLGVTHVSGNYHFTDKPFIEEGVDTIEHLGTSILKMWLTPSYVDGYGYNSNWDSVRGKVGDVYTTPIKSMTDLISTGYYQTALKRSGIKTLVFVATEFYWNPATQRHRQLNWKDGLSTVEHDSIVSEFKALTVYLRNNPDLAGKTIVLQNWEGDNHLNFDSDGARVSYQDSCIAGMIQWLNARQEGIDSGRAATPLSDVIVAGAAEFNQIPGNGRTFPYKLGIDHVVPFLNMDLYSWSNYTGASPGEEWKVIDCLDYIRSKRSASALFGEDNIMMGEFGCAANRRTGDALAKDISQREVIGKQVELAMRWGARYIILWEIYCNGWLSSATPQPPPYNAGMSELDGFWLIRPDSVLTQTWHQFKSIMGKTFTDYKDIYQAENQQRSGSDPIILMNNNNANGYYYDRFAADAVNDFISYTIYVPRAGTYQLQVSLKKTSAAAKFQLYVDDVAVGGVKDGYSAAGSSDWVDFGNIGFSTLGDKVLTFKVTGKHLSSTGYDIILDAFRLTDTGLPAPSVTPFTAGNVVISQSGNGNPVAAGYSAPVFLKEFSPSGVNTNTVAIPVSSSVARLTLNNATLGLNLSEAKDRIILGGYDAAPGTAAVATTSGISRSINIIGPDAMVLNAAKKTSSTFFSTALRGIAGSGDDYWGAGAGTSANNGLVYAAADTLVQLSNAIASTRNTGIHNGQLYFSTGTGAGGQIGIYKAGTGLPQTSGQTLSIYINTTGSGSGTASPYGFVFSDNGDTCYIADDRSIANGGGIQKWVFNGSGWTLAYTLSPTTTTQTVGARGVAVDFNGPYPVVYATTAENVTNRLVKILDTGASATAILLSTSPVNCYYNGVCLSPSLTALPARTATKAYPLLTANMQEETSTLQVYPNPFAGELNVIHGRKASKARIAICSVDGKELFTQHIPQESIRSNLNIKSLPAGIYILAVYNKGICEQTKMIIKK